MSQTMVAIPGYNVISELRDTVAPRSFRARELESLEVVTLHLVPRGSISRGVLVAAQSDAPRFAGLRHPRLARLRRLRADDEHILIETDHAGSETLEALLAREGRLAPSRAMTIAEDLLVGLVAGEMRGLYHGAIRPACVVLDRAGRAALDGLGFGGLVPGPQDFYGVLDRLVPVSGEQCHAKDVFAVAALLFHMLEGRPPLPAEKSRMRRDAWPRTKFDALFGAVAPLDRAEAGTLLRLIRQTDAEPITAPQPVLVPSLLDVVETPPPPAKPVQLERARDAARRLAASPIAPAVGAAAVGLFVALVFAQPFLGGAAMPTTSELALPAAAALPPSSSNPSAAPAVRPSTAAVVPGIEADPLRERVIALSEIGDFRSALEALKSATRWNADELREEVHAILAKAHDRFRDINELSRALAAEGRVKEAEFEWDALEAHWPTAELAAQAKAEREKISVIALALQVNRAQALRERAWRRAEAEFREFASAQLADEDYEFAPRLKKAEEFYLKAGRGEHAGLRDDAEALLQALMYERDFFAHVQEQIEKRFKRVLIGSCSTRFGQGEIVELASAAIKVKRTDGTETIPLARLSSVEKHALFAQYRNPRTGRQALALAMLALRWSLKDQVQLELGVSESANESPTRPISVVRRILEEAGP